MRTVETLRHRMIRCILFDLGDTLWTGADAETWEPLLQAAERRAQAILAAHITPALIQSIQGQGFRQAVREASRAYFSLHPGYEPSIVENIQAALTSLSLPLLACPLVRPDLIIEHLGDLLTFLPKVGTP